MTSKRTQNNVLHERRFSSSSQASRFLVTQTRSNGGAPPPPPPGKQPFDGHGTGCPAPFFRRTFEIAALMKVVAYFGGFARVFFWERDIKERIDYYREQLGFLGDWVEYLNHIFAPYLFADVRNDMTLLLPRMMAHLDDVENDTESPERSMFQLDFWSTTLEWHSDFLNPGLKLHPFRQPLSNESRKQHVRPSVDPFDEPLKKKRRIVAVEDPQDSSEALEMNFKDIIVIEEEQEDDHMIVEDEEIVVIEDEEIVVIEDEEIVVIEDEEEILIVEEQNTFLPLGTIVDLTLPEFNKYAFSFTYSLPHLLPPSYGYRFQLTEVEELMINDGTLKWWNRTDLSERFQSRYQFEGFYSEDEEAKKAYENELLTRFFPKLFIFN